MNQKKYFNYWVARFHNGLRVNLKDHSISGIIMR